MANLNISYSGCVAFICGLLYFSSHLSWKLLDISQTLYRIDRKRCCYECRLL